MFSFPPSAALAAGERGNTGSLPWRVYRVGGVAFLAGGALEVVAWPVRIRVSPFLPLSVVDLGFAGVECAAFCASRSADLGCGWSLCAVGEATLLAARAGDLVLPSYRRRIGVVPDGDAGQVRWCVGDLRSSFGAPSWIMASAAVRECGPKVGDLATSLEVVRRWPQIRGGRSLGCVPGQWSSSDFISSSFELVFTVARHRRRARSFSVPLEVDEGGFQQCCHLYPLCLSSTCMCLCNEWVKIHNDAGLSVEVAKGGAGGIARSSAGFIGAWSKPYPGITDPMIAEALSLRDRKSVV